MKSLLKMILTLVIILFLSTSTIAQPEWEDDPIDTPIDGGLSLLLASGIGLGLHSANRRLKK
jgi:hypothetical protein